MRECEVEGCSNGVFSKNRCKFHQKRKALKRGKFVSKRKASSSNDEMREFFLSIWSKRVHRSEASGKSLGSEPLSTMFHHIILKSDIIYGELGKFDEDNIILLLPEEHEMVHKNMYKYEEINRRREKLIEKYEKISPK